VCVQLDASEDSSGKDVDRLFFIYNSNYEPQWAKLPQLPAGEGWYRAIDTSLPSGEDFLEAGKEIAIDPPDHYLANPRSTVVLLAQVTQAAQPARPAKPTTATAVPT
jgi:glycogen operon protein